MPRVIAHVDMDAFFAAIEQRDRPELRGKPVVVGGSPGGRGVVSTASYEARKFGIHSAMPIAQAVKRCPNAVFLPPDFARYSDASRQLRTMLDDYSPLVAQTSVDEAYLDLTGMESFQGSPREAALSLKNRVREVLRLTATVGIGPNRLIAKIASDFRKPDGLTIVEPADVTRFLAPLVVSKIPGIGRRTNERLEEMGIRTIGRLAGYSREVLVRRFGESLGAMLYRKSHGEGSDLIEPHEGRKSVSKERTFAQDVIDPEELRAVILRLAGDLGRTLRREAITARGVHLKIRLEGFETHTRSRTLPEATDEDRVVFETAWELCRESGYLGRPVRLIGVGLAGLGPRAGVQLNLFDQQRHVRDDRLYSAMDRIRERFGKASILPADAFAAPKPENKPAPKG